MSEEIRNSRLNSGMENKESSKNEMSTLLEIKQLQNRMNEIKSELMSKTHFGRYFAGEVVQVLLKTKEVCQESISYVENCVLTDTEITDLPQLPFKIILKCLKMEDKRNLRLVSKTLNGLIDDLDKGFKVWKVYLSQDRLPDRFKYFVESGKDISIVMSDSEMSTDVINFVTIFSHRIIEIEAPSQTYSQIQIKDMSKVEQIKIFSTTEFCVAEMPAEISTCFMNLKVLTLCDIKLQPIENLEFRVLHDLTLDKVEDNGGLAPLLAACAQTLDYIEMKNAYHPDISDLSVEMNKLDYIRLENCRGMKGFFNLVSLSKSCLERIDVRNTNLDEEIPLNQEYSLAKLSVLVIYDSCETFANLLTWKVPKLKQIYLDNIRHLKKHEVDLPSVVKICIWNEENDSVVEDCLNILLPRCANGLEKLLIYNLSDKVLKEIQFSEKLQSLKLLFLLGFDIDCHFQTEIIKRAPNLEELYVSKFTASAISSCKAIKKICIEEFVINDVSAYNAISRFNLVELVIVECDELEIPELVECQLNLKTLCLEDSSVSGFHNLLRACSSSLEQLILAKSSTQVTLKRINFEMKSLKTISVYEGVDLGKDGLQFLLRSCSGVLERLMFTLPDQEIKEIFPDDLFLPQLKILHTHPKPSFNVLCEINKHLPGGVILWFFKPEDYVDISDQFLNK